MRSYPPSVAPASRMTKSAVTGTPAGTVVVCAAGLQVNGGTVTAAGRGPSAGEPAVTAPAVIRRDGTVPADGRLPDLVRLGGLETYPGDGVIEAIVGTALEKGRLKPRQRRRIMSSPLVIRLMSAMALMPDASYCEALARLAGLLADIPFALEWHVPADKVVTDWRLPVRPALREDLFGQAAGPLIADDEPSAVMLAGMPVGAADGRPVSLAGTPANRAFFGSTGTADGSSPFPQLRIVAVTARAGRARLGAIPGQAGTGEQTLLKRLVKRRPGLFAGRVVCFDRNFPGHDLVAAILDAGGHVVARVKEGISLPFQDGQGRGRLPDGSRVTWLNAPSGKKADRLPVRAAGHNVTMPGVDGQELVSETCTVITTLLDHEAAPADTVRDACLTRWGAAETTSGEDKSTITGAGNRTSGPVLRSGTPRLVISEARAWLAGTQLVRAGEAGGHAAARALRRRNRALVTAGEESFTTARHHAIRSMTSTRVTAVSSPEALADAADSAARACLHTLSLPGRQRHSGRAQEARPKFPHAGATKTTVTGKPQVTVFAPGFSWPAAAHGPRERRNPPRPARDPRPVEPRAVPAATRGHQPCLRTNRKQTSGHEKNTGTLAPQEVRNT